MSKVNLCILGCGSVARLHSRIARTLRSRVNLLYASRSREKAEEYNKKFRGVGAFGSYEEACSDPRVDAVFVCTPHACHVEHVRLAAGGNKAVLVEKPVARNMEEFAAIERAVADAGVISMVAENYFFKPLAAVIRHHIERGDVGRPTFLELNRAAGKKMSGWRADAEMMGGGALLEGGVHWVNLLASIGGKVTEVAAARPRESHDLVAPFEDSIELLVKFENGSVGKLLHSWNSVNRIGGLGMSKIYGTDGNIFFESNGIFVLVLGRRKRLRFPGFIDIMGYRAMLRHFVECVREDKPASMSLAVARHDMQIVFAAYRSLESGAFEAVRGS
ncbi:MAG: Gfo/Idh/MocA family oxidoreductase [Gemmatimonadota bacterium]|nr:MAG: Gfo/Idh/MocA family oxidoreductase [Gemmatimonadota bacterium]